MLNSRFLLGGLILRGVDPGGGRQSGWCRRLADEALRVSGVGVGEDALALGEQVGGATVVDALRGEQPDAAVTMLGVVPGEEAPAEGASVLDRAEAAGEVGTALER